MDARERIETALADPRVRSVHLSNWLRRDLEISKKAAQRVPKLRVHQGLPGLVLVVVHTARRDNVEVYAYDAEAEAFARDFEARPDWRLLGL